MQSNVRAKIQAFGGFLTAMVFLFLLFRVMVF